MKILTIGTFDIFHTGHLNLLLKCRKFGDVIVGVNTDDFVAKFKRKPVMNEVERSDFIKQLGFETVYNNSNGKDLILKIKPDVLAIGSDWASKDYYKQIGMTQDDLDNAGIMLLYIPYTKGLSTTELKKRLNA